MDVASATNRAMTGFDELHYEVQDAEGKTLTRRASLAVLDSGQFKVVDHSDGSTIKVIVEQIS